jgi:hypothetical protein
LSCNGKGVVPSAQRLHESILGDAPGGARRRSEVSAAVEHEQCGKPDGGNRRKPDEVGVMSVDALIGSTRRATQAIETQELTACCFA